MSRIDWATAGLSDGVLCVATGVNGAANCKSLWIWADSAGGQISIADPAVTAGEVFHTLTTSPTRVALSEAAGTQPGNGGLWIRKRSGAPASVYVWAPRLQVGPDSGAADDELTLTTTAAIHPPRITYDPITLACLGMLVEGQASDTAQDTGLNAAVTAAQNRTVTATPWTVQFHGTGTVTLSGAHTAVITGTGLYQQASLTFTPSAGTLTMTPSGDVKNLDLINQAYPSSSIVNTTAGSVTRPADPIVLSGSAFTERFGPIQAAGAGTLVIEFRVPLGSTTAYALCDGLTRRFAYRNSGSNAWYAYDGVNTFGFGVIAPGTDAKVAVSFNGSSATSAANGVVITAPSTHTGSFLTAAALTVGNFELGASFALNSTIARISYIPRYITGAELAALTA